MRAIALVYLMLAGGLSLGAFLTSNLAVVHLIHF